MSLIVPLALAACATPESRVRSKLIEVGVSKPVAQCMAGRMVDNLSNAQLRRLASLGDMHGKDITSMRMGELLEQTKTLGDPKIFTVISRAALGCSIAG